MLLLVPSSPHKLRWLQKLLYRGVSVFISRRHSTYYNIIHTVGGAEWNKISPLTKELHWNVFQTPSVYFVFPTIKKNSLTVYWSFFSGTYLPGSKTPCFFYLLLLLHDGRLFLSVENISMPKVCWYFIVTIFCVSSSSDKSCKNVHWSELYFPFAHHRQGG